MKEIFSSIGINIISAIITSIGMSVVIYFKFFKHIPEEVEKRLDTMLNNRLAGDASWHNSVITAVSAVDTKVTQAINTNVMQALNPNNQNLSLEHKDLERSLHFLTEEAIRAQERRNSSGGGIDVGKVIALYEKLAEDNVLLRIGKNRIGNANQFAIIQIFTN